MRLALAILILVVCSFASWAAQPAAPPPSPPPQVVSDFDRNLTLGSILTTRAGTQEELAELSRLADRGLAAARAAAAKSPNSPETQYDLGGWLLYGYRVVQLEQMRFDPQTGARRVTISQAQQGLSDDPTEGLAALKQASNLAPKSIAYLLDYAAALIDCERAFEASGPLKALWAGNPPASLPERMRAGLLLSTIAFDSADLAGAREWVYSALALDPDTADALDRLRRLDAAQIAEAAAAQAAEEWYWEEEAGEEEVAPEQYDESVEPPAAEEEYNETPHSEEPYYEEPGGAYGDVDVPQPPEPPSAPGYEPSYPEPPSAEGEMPGYGEGAPTEPPGYEEGPTGQIPGYEEGPPGSQEGVPGETPGYEEESPAEPPSDGEPSY